ncbi:hypothetical protein CMI37_23915 [Candidatus Pacearchaeota archaeon]|nr:hypothetical protein [Candidatus Pacearchaeota archaeon]|tara:strand:+ start:29 stop:940 length:912 start_codon:yes stop_codon:yes gene_type:complete
MANERANEWASWEVDPSTRTSVHAFTKYAPITATLSTTAADVFTVDRGIPSVNLVRNPSIELNALTEFTASGAAIAQSSAQAATGTYSLLVNPANSAAGEGFYYTTPNLVGHPEGSYLVASAEVRGASASGNVRLVLQDSSGVELATSATHSLTAGFLKISAQCLVGRPPATYRVAILSVAQHNIDFYVDKMHVEVRQDSTIPDYVDGAQGVNYEWTGTANASESKRRAGMSVMRGLRIKNDHGSIAVYVAFDQTASATTGFQIAAGEVFETVWPVDFRTRISAVAASGTPAIHGVVWGIHQG